MRGIDDATVRYVDVYLQVTHLAERCMQFSESPLLHQAFDKPNEAKGHPIQRPHRRLSAIRFAPVSRSLYNSIDVSRFYDKAHIVLDPIANPLNERPEVRFVLGVGCQASRPISWRKQVEVF